MPPVLIDTNVLIYASDPSEIIRQDQALRILKHLETARLGRLSVQCLAEFMNATTRSRRTLYTQEEAIQQLERLLRAYPIFDLTPLIVLEAARGVRDYGLSYFNALQGGRLGLSTTLLSANFAN